jgi:hypothetical protein
MTRRTKALVIVGAILAIAVAVRAFSPIAVAAYVNRHLASLGEYRGAVGEVDLAVIRGGYTLYDVSIVKVDADVETPFVAVDQMDLSLQWRALFRGHAVGEVVMYRPDVNFVQSPSEEQSQYGAGVNWPEEIRDLFPFRLNRVRVVDGLVTFRAPGIEADESMTARGVQVELLNLTNVQNLESEAFASIDATGQVMGNAPLRLTGQIDPNDELPMFDIDLSLEQAMLVDINPWLREFLKADAQAGVFSLYAELAAADGRFEGYLKPILENPEFFSADESATGPFRKAWEALVGFAAKVLENRTQDQVATQIPLSGEFEDPDAGVLPALVNLLRNAFVAGFAHSLEGTINFRDVGDAATCFATSDQPEAQAGAAPDGDAGREKPSECD